MGKSSGVMCSRLWQILFLVEDINALHDTLLLTGKQAYSPVCKPNDRAKFDTSMKISHLMKFEA